MVISLARQGLLNCVEVALGHGLGQVSDGPLVAADGLLIFAAPQQAFGFATFSVCLRNGAKELKRKPYMVVKVQEKSHVGGTRKEYDGIKVRENL